MPILLSRYGTVTAVVALGLLAGCASQQRTPTLDVAAAPGQKVTVEIRASNFKFNPSVIIARRGDTLVLHIANASGERHNLTVKDPSGQILRSEDLLGHETATVEIPLNAAGIYPFYCDVDLHSRLGMKGRIEVKE
jgi:plastocyanin